MCEIVNGELKEAKSDDVDLVRSDLQRSKINDDFFKKDFLDKNTRIKPQSIKKEISVHSRDSSKDSKSSK